MNLRFRQPPCANTADTVALDLISGSRTGVEAEIDASHRSPKRQAAGHLQSFGLPDDNDPLTGQHVAGSNTPYAPRLITNVSARYLVHQHLVYPETMLTAAVRTMSRTFFHPANQFSQGPAALLDLCTEFAINPKMVLRLFANNVTVCACRT